MTPSKGFTVYYTDDVTHVATTPAALPTTFPLAGADLATWTQIHCVQDVTGIDAQTVETTEHRCLDADKPLVEDFSTGFIKADPISITPTYDELLETEFRAGKLARTKYRLLFVFALDEDQTTTPDHFAWKVRCTKTEPMVDAGGKPIDLKLEFVVFDDTGVYVSGS